jgi:hypothetical protein
MLIQLALAALILLSLLTYFGWFLIKKSPDHFRAVLYFYYLSACSCLVALWWAKSSGAIDESGEPTNMPGRILFWVLSFCVDLETDFKIFGATMFIAFGPQILTYLTAGFVARRAQSRIMYEYIMDPLLYMLGKSVITFSGLTLVMFPFAYIFKLGDVGKTLTLPMLIVYVLASTGFLSITMFALAVVQYRRELSRLAPAPAQALILRFHRRMISRDLPILKDSSEDADESQPGSEIQPEGADPGKGNSYVVTAVLSGIARVKPGS